MTRAAIYARQSVTDDELIDVQVAKCEALAAAKDFDVVEIYRDNNVSGYKARDEGTAFSRMLKDARAGRFDVVVVRKLDRLGRSLAALESFAAARVAVVTIDENIDLTTVNGRLIANLLTSVARAEVEIKAERRVNANTARRQREGAAVPTSGRVPYGYRWVPTKDRGDDGTAYVLDGEKGAPDTAAEHDDSRAADVRELFDAFLAGVPLGSIARDLNAKGRRTKPSKAHPAGVPFTPTTLRRMLMSPYYAARMPAEAATTYDQRALSRHNTVAGAWPAIVDVEEWEEAKKRLEHPERKTSPGPTRKWLLSGLAICGTEGCGKPIRAGGGEAGIHSYRCASMAHFMRRGVPLDDFVERVVIARLSRPDAVDLLDDRERHDVDELRAERRRLETAVRQAGDDEMDGLIDRAERVRLTRRANARIAELDEKLRAGVDTTALAEVVGSDDVAAAWHGLTLGKKRAILEALATVVVYSVGQGNRRRMSDEAMARTVRFDWH
ncbi:recombinase family protein [uncultured Microbacterium sp.]|uniref:recombinase family protein n=1 Tax=uncultured Microbacterium sp. TaxID=191216 RepID=UPI0026057212|nr:recombinase family protein [uncultured Microbacterium sp.]